jgi:hypothetical protein
MAPIDGGNSRLVERMFTLSEGRLRLRTLVAAISPGFSRQYRLSITGSTSEAVEEEDWEFDVVMLATPILHSGIDLGRFGLHLTRVQTSSDQAHVTHFFSTVPLSSNLSMLPLDVNLVDGLTSTISSTTQGLNVWNIQRSEACFRRYCLPRDECVDWRAIFMACDLSGIAIM